MNAVCTKDYEAAVVRYHLACDSGQSDDVVLESFRNVWSALLATVDGAVEDPLVQEIGARLARSLDEGKIVKRALRVPILGDGRK